MRANPGVTPGVTNDIRRLSPCIQTARRSHALTHARAGARTRCCTRAYATLARARSLAHPTRNADAKAKRELASSKRANNAGCRRWFNKRVVSQITVRHVAHTDAAHREMPNNATTRTDDTPTAMHAARCSAALKIEMRNDRRVAPQRYLTASLGRCAPMRCDSSRIYFLCAKRSRREIAWCSLFFSLSLSPGANMMLKK